jgi:hypothetical protein
MFIAILEPVSLLGHPRDFLRHCERQWIGLRDQDCPKTMPSSGQPVALGRKQGFSKTRVLISADGDAEVSTVLREGGGRRITRGESLTANSFPKCQRGIEFSRLHRRLVSGILPNHPRAAGGNFICPTNPVMTGLSCFSVIVFPTNIVIRDFPQNNPVHSMTSSGTEKWNSSPEHLLAMELPHPFIFALLAFGVTTRRMLGIIHSSCYQRCW